MQNYNPYYQNFFPNNNAQQNSNGFQNGNSYQQQPIIQNGGFISVRSAQEAFNYPVAPGNSVTFKDEYQPYVYSKTQGFSQLERPIFKRFRLVEETDEPQQQPQNSGMVQQSNTEYALKTDFDALCNVFKSMEKELTAVKAEITALKEVEDNV